MTDRARQTDLTLEEALTRLDQQNWHAIAHRLSVEHGINVDAHTVRAIAHTELTRYYPTSRP